MLWFLLCFKHIKVIFNVFSLHLISTKASSCCVWLHIALLSWKNKLLLQGFKAAPQSSASIALRCHPCVDWRRERTPSTWKAVKWLYGSCCRNAAAVWLDLWSNKTTWIFHTNYCANFPKCCDVHPSTSCRDVLFPSGFKYWLLERDTCFYVGILVIGRNNWVQWAYLVMN